MGTASRLEGIGFDVLELKKHAAVIRLGYPVTTSRINWPSYRTRVISNGAAPANGMPGTRRPFLPCNSPRDGNDHEAYDRFATEINADARTNCTLRGLLEFKAGAAGGTHSTARGRTR